MAKDSIKAGLRMDTPFYGEYGNKACAHLSDTLVAASTGAINNCHAIGIIPGGSKIVGFREAHAALTTGAGAVTVSWGWEYVDGSAGGSETALLAAVTHDAAGGNVATGLIPFVVEKDIYITCTTTVEAAAGDVHALVDFIPLGMK